MVDASRIDRMTKPAKNRPMKSAKVEKESTGGAYVPTVSVGMYAPLEEALRGAKDYRGKRSCYTQEHNFWGKENACGEILQRSLKQ